VVEEAFLSGAFRYEDLVAAADVVITKPGYGIIAECVSTRTAMLYTSRGVFREYDVLVDALPRVVRSRFINQADLLAGRWRSALEAVVAQPPPAERLAVDGADVAARRLAGWLA
jgi:L-arabinokinase